MEVGDGKVVVVVQEVEEREEVMEVEGGKIHVDLWLGGVNLDVI